MLPVPKAAVDAPFHSFQPIGRIHELPRAGVADTESTAAPRVEPLGDLPTKLAICQPNVNRCWFYRAVVDFFGCRL